MLIGVLRPLLCSWQVKWAERPPKVMEVKDETPFRQAHAEIRTQAVVISGRTRYQLDHEGADRYSGIIINNIIAVNDDSDDDKDGCGSSRHQNAYCAPVQTLALINYNSRTRPRYVG